MSVQPLTSFDPQQFFNLESRPGGGSHQLETRISGLSVSQEFSGRLNVTTADGDTITLVADRDDAYDAGAIESSVRTRQGTGTLNAEHVQSAHVSHVGVSVTGDLSEAEVTDLEKLFEKVSGIFRGFFQGQDEGAKAQILQLADGVRGLESVSSLDLSVEIVRAVTVVSASDSTPGGAPGTAAVIPQSSTGTTAPTPSPDSSAATYLAAPVNGAQFASLIQQVLDALNEVRADIQKVRQHLPAFLDKVREELAKELRQEPQSASDNRRHSAEDVQGSHEPATDSRSLLVAYHTATVTSTSFSLQA